jgi:hypothetical protein
MTREVHRGGFRRHVAVLVPALAVAARASASDEWTLYELLAPDTHRFAITYEVAAVEPGARVFLNPIREGAVSSDERVVDASRGQPLRFRVVTGAEAKAERLARETVKDEARFLRVELPAPVPESGEARLRIHKTYADPRAYFREGERIVFERGLSIRRNAVVLPAGYELVASSVPAIVSTEPDGRVKASFVNDRDDVLPVRLVGRSRGRAR